MRFPYLRKHTEAILDQHQVKSLSVIEFIIQNCGTISPIFSTTSGIEETKGSTKGERTIQSDLPCWLVHAKKIHNSVADDGSLLFPPRI